MIVSIGTVIFSTGLIVCFTIYVVEAFNSIKELISHYAFRIMANTTVESEDLNKKLEENIERIMTRVMSKVLIKILDQRDENKRNKH